MSSNLQRQWSISQGHLEFSEHIHLYNPKCPRKTHNCYKGCLNKLCLNPLTVPYINRLSQTYQHLQRVSIHHPLGFKDGTPLKVQVATCSLKKWALQGNPQKSFIFQFPGLQARDWCKLQPYHWSFVSAATPPGTSQFGIVTRGSGSCSWQI